LTDFASLGLAAPLLRALNDQDYTTPTPIQSQAIPPARLGRDLLGIAQTGTGKTAAFALPLLDRLAAAQIRPPQLGCHILVLAPTRELASQIADSFRDYGRHMRISVTTVFGGAPHGRQIRAMARGVDVLVATPGRLLDHLSGGTVRLDGVKALVLDEADQMLDLGFVEPIRRIVARLPKQRQTLFFSATMPAAIGRLADEMLTDPVKVSVAPQATTAERVAQRVIRVDAADKRMVLGQLLNSGGMARTLVFVRTKHGADRLVKQLMDVDGIDSVAIHGNRSQPQRERALAAFRDGRVGVLVATDIAARGIDVDGVTHVVNHDLPFVPEAYVHRIGRTARAGAAGEAISLVSAEDAPLLRDIEKLIRQAIPAEDRRRNPVPDATQRPRPGGGQQRPQRGKPDARRAGPPRRRNGPPQRRAASA
jgi:ATP-dependent RNA helicase RhlE